MFLFTIHPEPCFVNMADTLRDRMVVKYLLWLKTLFSHFTASCTSWGRLSWAFVFGTACSAVHWASSEWGGCRTSVYQHQARMTSLLEQPEVRWPCCSADTRLFQSQFKYKSLSHSDVLCRAGLCLGPDTQPTEMDRILLTVLQQTPAKSLNSPYLTSLPWNRDNHHFFTQCPSCSTQQIPNHSGRKRREGKEGQMVSS